MGGGKRKREEESASIPPPPNPPPREAGRVELILPGTLLHLERLTEARSVDLLGRWRGGVEGVAAEGSASGAGGGGMGWDGTGWEASEVWSQNLLAPEVRLGSGRRLLFLAPRGCVQLDGGGGGGGGVLSDGFVGWERYVSSRGDLGQAFLDAFFDT